MYLFYDSNGNITSFCGGDSIEGKDDEISYIPEGTTALYLDDTEYEHLKNNKLNYKIRDRIPIYTPLSESDILINLNDIKKSKIEEINSKCNLEIVGGFHSNCTTTIEHKFKFDLEWQANLNRQMNMLMLDLTIKSVEWNTIDIGWITLSREEFIVLYQDSNRFIESKLSRCKKLNEQIMNAKTSTEIKLINW